MTPTAPTHPPALPWSRGAVAYPGQPPSRRSTLREEHTPMR